MSFRKYKIEKDYKNVYYFLKEKGFSENYIKNLRKEFGYIKVNNVSNIIRTPLHINDILEIEASPNNKTTIMRCIIPLNIVYEDEYYLLVNKESGISCMPNKSHYSYNLAGAICAYMQNKDKNFTLRIINRLDKDTAGIIIIAKDSISQQEIKDVNKIYTAICHGKINKTILIDKNIETEIENNMGNKINIIKRKISKNGKKAVTKVIPLKCNVKSSLIELEVIHGRTQQIRVHLSSINHALIGDEIYGTKSELINHTALICNQVSFYHPYLHEHLNFSIPYPNDFNNLLNELF